MHEALNVGECLSLGWETFTKNAVALIVGFILVLVVSGVTLGICLAPMVLGYNMMLLRAVRGEQVDLSNTFDGFGRFIPSLLLLIVTSVAVTIGLVLCLIPGLVAGYLFFWAMWVMADGEDDFLVCIRRSVDLNREHVGPVVVFMLVNSIVQLLGGAVPVVGSLVVVPIAMAMVAHGYDRAFSVGNPIDVEIASAIQMPPPIE